MKVKKISYGLLRYGLLVAFLLFLSLANCVSTELISDRPQFTIERLPRYEALFQGSSGWTGGDGAFSTVLDTGRDRVLWLFGDTFVGDVVDGRHVNYVLPRNTGAIQTGLSPESASLVFYYGHTPQGTPGALLPPPEDGPLWFWPAQPVRTKVGLFLFLIETEDIPPPCPLGFCFKTKSSWLCQINNPYDPPDHWNFFHRRKIPWSNGKRLFGSSILIKGEDCYIFGWVLENTGVVDKQMILAKVRTDYLADFSQWRFYSDGAWVADADRASRLVENVANEFSVSFQKALNQYLLLYTAEPFTNKIVFRLAPEPFGPWGEPVTIYGCPEADKDPRIYCYAAKGHPELSFSPEDLVVTYLTNSQCLKLIESDASQYRPRFLRLRFQPIRK